MCKKKGVSWRCEVNDPPARARGEIEKHSASSPCVFYHIIEPRRQKGFHQIND